MLIVATNKSIDVVRGKLTPGSYLGGNFKNLVENTELGNAMINSLKYAILLTLLSLLIYSFAGYGFEIYHTRGKDRLFSVCSFQQCVSLMQQL